METIVIGAAAGVGAVLLLVGLVNLRARRKRGPGAPLEGRERGEPLSWTYTTASSDLSGVFGALGLDARGETAGVGRWEGGSQVKTRLLGGYFVKPGDLPITVLVGPSREAGGRRSVVVRDRIGPIGLRDRALAERYANRAEEIRQAVSGLETRQ